MSASGDACHEHSCIITIRIHNHVLASTQGGAQETTGEPDSPNATTTIVFTAAVRDRISRFGLGDFCFHIRPIRRALTNMKGCP